MTYFFEIDKIPIIKSIIVLLILAGVSIATLTGENGVLTKANTAKTRQSHAQVEESIKLAYSEYQTEILTKSTTGHVNTKVASMETVKVADSVPIAYMSFMEFLYKEKECIDENGVIDTEALTGGKTSLGNGEGLIDVYKIEDDEANHQYVLTYYETADKTEELCTIKQSEMPETKTVKIYTDDTFSEVYFELPFIENITWKEYIENYYSGDDLYISSDGAGIVKFSSLPNYGIYSSNTTGYGQVNSYNIIELTDYYLRLLK